MSKAIKTSKTFLSAFLAGFAYVSAGPIVERDDSVARDIDVGTGGITVDVPFPTFPTSVTIPTDSVTLPTGTGLKRDIHVGTDGISVDVPLPTLPTSVNLLTDSVTLPTGTETGMKRNVHVGTDGISINVPFPTSFDIPTGPVTVPTAVTAPTTM